jgi:hypothetical protein
MEENRTRALLDRISRPTGEVPVRPPYVDNDRVLTLEDLEEAAKILDSMEEERKDV